MNTTNGRLAEMSKKSFTEALLRIMQQYDFKEITVTQIAQEAKLSRKTFYRLFSDKEEILELLLKNLFEEFFCRLKELKLHHYWEVVELYFDFWEKHRKILVLFVKHELLYLLFNETQRHSIETFSYVRSPEIADEYSETLPYLLAYSMGGMNSMLLKWVENDMKTPPQLLIGQLKQGFASFDI